MEHAIPQPERCLVLTNSRRRADQEIAAASQPQIKLRIADIVIRLVTCGLREDIRIPRKFLPFVCDDAHDADFDVQYGSVQDAELGHRVFSAKQAWSVYERDDTLAFEVTRKLASPAAWALLSPDLSSGRVVIADCVDHRNALEHLLRGLLSRLLLIGLLSRNRGVMLHASGVKIGTTGLLFAGEDGAGKSTMARLWAKYANGTVIGDDHIVIRKRQSRYWMYSTPWHGMDCVASAVPIDSIFIIHHGTRNQLSQLTPAIAATHLLKRSFPPHWSREGMHYSLQLLGQLCTAIPTYDFAFLPDRSAVDLLNATLETV